jgi:hypothetical protein
VAAVAALLLASPAAAQTLKVEAPSQRADIEARMPALANAALAQCPPSTDCAGHE